MNAETLAFTRRTDLDALRAGAMLLGIILHASLSFFPSFWIVTDCRQEPGFGIVFSAIHGFRMPLFFVMSGFFSAMLLHRRGWKSLVKQRFHRVLLPLLLGMVTIVPLTVGMSALAMSSTTPKSGGTLPTKDASGIWGAARAGDLSDIEQYLSNGISVDAVDPEQGGTPLMWAAVKGQTEAIQLLIRRGADVNSLSQDGGTALHAAAFLGHEGAVDVLVQNQAKVNARNNRGNTPLDVAILDEGTTRYFASLLQLELDEEGLGHRKAAIAQSLRQHGATIGLKSSLADTLMQMPLFHHLWFLWFLWWLVVGYAMLSAFGPRLSSIRLPDWVFLSPARYLWLIPLTMIPQWYMGNFGTTPIIGPDTSTGLLPIPHVFAFYAIFFGFGVIYFGYNDQSDRLGKRWWLELTIGLIIILPLMLALTQGWKGPAGYELPPFALRIIVVVLQATYPWFITFGLIGLLRQVCSFESSTLQYLSDSAYWLYLAHLPLIIAAQYIVRDLPYPAIVKFLLIVVVVTAFLLWTYQVMVRYRWLGRFLNGPRTRPNKTIN